MYAVYLLVDFETYLVYYVGMSKNYIQRFRGHINEAYRIAEIRAQGIDLLPALVMLLPTRELALEYELRWIYHCIQTRQPLINKETKQSFLTEYIQESSLDFLNMPASASVHNELIKNYLLSLHKRAAASRPLLGRGRGRADTARTRRAGRAAHPGQHLADTCR